MCFPPRVSVDMELGRVPADLYAGYIEDDSDLEYSGAEEYSNDDRYKPTNAPLTT